MSNEALLSAVRKAVDMFGIVAADDAPPKAEAFYGLLREPSLVFTPGELDGIKLAEDRALAWALWREVERRGMQEIFGFPANQRKAELTAVARLKMQLKTQRTSLRPLTAEEALQRWYAQEMDTDKRLSGKSHLLVAWLCILASEEDGAPLAYTIKEMGRRFNWTEPETWQAAEVARDAGYIELERDALILTDPRARKAVELS